SLVFGRFVAEVEVRSVMTDLHPVQPGEDIARGVGELAGEFPARVTEELAACGVRGLAGDPELLEGEGVDYPAVAGSVHDVDFSVVGHLVEFVPARVALFGEVALFVTETADRRPLLQLRRLPSQNLDHLGNRACLVGGDIDPAEQLTV